MQEWRNVDDKGATAYVIFPGWLKGKWNFAERGYSGFQIDVIINELKLLALG